MIVDLALFQMESLQYEYSIYNSKNHKIANSGFFLVKRHPTSDKISIGTLSQWTEFTKDSDSNDVSMCNKIEFTHRYHLPKHSFCILHIADHNRFCRSIWITRTSRLAAAKPSRLRQCTIWTAQTTSAVCT